MSDLARFIDRISAKKVSRKGFLKLCVALLAFLPFGGGAGEAAQAGAAPFNGRLKKGIRGLCDLAVAKGDDPYQLAVKAVEAMGGMGLFVKRNDVVVVKPNIGWDRTAAQAADTNPQVVAALVDLAFGAGAKKVKVFDRTCNDARRCYAASGIAEAAKAKGATVFFADDWDVIDAHFGFASPMEDWPVLREAVECDTFVNVPILKHHGLTGLTVSMKNLMGVCGGRRGEIHQDIGRKLVDLTRFINPDLTIVDAYRVLLRNGPTGGNEEDVALLKTVVAATDPTLVDAYACTLVKQDPMSIPNIRVAAELHYGTTDIGAAHIIGVTA